MLLNIMNDAAWYALGAVAAALTSFGFVPQAVRMWRTKSVRDVSPLMIIQFIAGVVLWTVYGVHLRNPVIIAANLVSLAILVMGLLLYFRFFKRGQP
jgi:MtN3 and saliva related transmembrane protein